VEELDIHISVHHGTIYENFPRENSEKPHKTFGQDAQETLKPRISLTGGSRENNISQNCL
jgi:hypothetical protein